ncbi:MAG: hypothetical protein PHO89_07230 [Methylacidiphilaceae bacterium]|nr:hypothetical protein [Candidatus Methylacidiphilaceae bacterium]
MMNRLGRGYSFEALRAKILFAEGARKHGNSRPKFARKTPTPAIRNFELGFYTPEPATSGIHRHGVATGGRVQAKINRTGRIGKELRGRYFHSGEDDRSGGDWMANQSRNWDSLKKERRGFCRAVLSGIVRGGKRFVRGFYMV